MLKVRWLTIIFIIVYSIEGNAQIIKKKRLDSLNHLLLKAQNDSNKVLILYEIGRSYSTINKDSVSPYIQKIQKLSEASKYLKGIELSRILQVKSNTSFTPLDSTISTYHQALEYFIASNEIEIIADIYNLMGVLYSDKSIVDIASEIAKITTSKWSFQ